MQNGLNGGNQEVDLSIVIPVYNHEKYIRQCIESVLMQQTEFTTEVLVGEDCSTDGSRRILKEMEKELPAFWHIYYRETNLGMTANGDDLYARTRGRYLITIEGDDYWTYPYKLQKQYEFLETHREYIAVSHYVTVVDTNDHPFPDYYDDRWIKHEYTLRDFFTGRMPGQTASIMMRNTYHMDDLPILVNPLEYPRDKKKVFMLTIRGKIRIIHQKWGVYRYVTDQGDSWSASKRVNGLNEITFLNALLEYVKSNSVEKDTAAEVVRCVEARKTWLYLKNAYKLAISALRMSAQQFRRQNTLFVSCYLLKQIRYHIAYKMMRVLGGEV